MKTVGLLALFALMFFVLLGAESEPHASEIEAHICDLRGRLSGHPEYYAATALGFACVGIETAQSVIRTSRECLQATSGLSPAEDMDIAYAVSPVWGRV